MLEQVVNVVTTVLIAEYAVWRNICIPAHNSLCPGRSQRLL